MSSGRKPKKIDPNEVDPSVYYYDEVYDDMERMRDEQSEADNKPKQHRGSKYLQGIIETAQIRKSEKEIRKVKRYARDREEAQASGELDGTDVYITKSYEKKLKEVQEALNEHPESSVDRTLNSFKLAKHHKGESKESFQERDISSTSTTTRDPRRQTPNATQANNGQHPAKEDTEISDLPPEIKNKVKRPKTIDERREFLREILAKRTVGEVFKAAQERYRQRKAKK